MESIVNSISEAILLLASLAVFAIIIKRVLPTIILRVDYSIAKGLGRGLEKYVYSDGRAVSYEPHPSIRKYIGKYLLFTYCGYKYFKCRVDNGVSTLKFYLFMFDNRDRIIDTLEVNARIGNKGETEKILLHPDTSYIALNVDAVNGLGVKKTVNCSYRRWRIAVYYFSLALLAFLETFLCAAVTENFLFTVCDMRVEMTESVGVYLLFAMTAAALGTLILLTGSKKRGIGVSGNGNEK